MTWTGWGGVEGLNPPSNVNSEFEHWFAQVIAEFTKISDTLYVLEASGATTLPDLTDVTSAAVTDRNVLVANGSAYVGRALEAADIQSGTFASALISQASVTQHQAALSIAASQVTPGTFGSGGGYTFPTSVVVSGTNLDRSLIINASGTTGPTGGHAFIELNGDSSNDAADPGGAYTLFSTDAGTVEAQVGLTKNAGWPDRSAAITGVSAGDFVIGPNTGTIRFVRSTTLLASLDATSLSMAVPINLNGQNLLNPGNILWATASVSFGSSVAAMTQGANATVTVTGAATGDHVWVCIRHAASGTEPYVIVSGYVSAANTVTVIGFNADDVTQNLANCNVNVLVIKA